MNWDDLKVLLALSREGSTRKAAATLGVSNTTVMRRLESLEEQVGGRLFDRTPDGFRATSLADQLLPAAREVEETLDSCSARAAPREGEGALRARSSALWRAAAARGGHPICFRPERTCRSRTSEAE